MSQSQPRGTADSPEEFFIPDLCNVQAILFLLLIAELLAIVLALAANGLSQFSWQSFSQLSYYLLWVFLASAAVLCQLRNYLRSWPLHWAATICYLSILLVATLSSVGGQWLLRSTMNSHGSLDVSMLLTHILICAILAGIALRYFYLTQQLRLRQRAELQARIQALQSRIRPHFLFNSMNIIASLIAVDQEAAECAVEDLSDLFRASLAETATEVTLKEELELCRRYVRIEKLRLADRLKIDWDIDKVPQDLNIPSLSLQPLLENAIYHGIQQLPQGGVVNVDAKYEKRILTIVVRNPISGTEHISDRDGNRLALDNINQRLKAIYGPSAGLTTREEGNVFHAEIQYPVTIE